MRLRSDEDAISPVVGTVLMVAITIVLGATALVLLTGDDKEVNKSPHIGFASEGSGDGGTFTVTRISNDDDAWTWDDVSISPSSTAVCTLPTGPIHSTDVVACTTEGTLILVYSIDSGESVIIFTGEVR